MKTYSRKSSSYIKKAFVASNFNEMCRLCLSELDTGLSPIYQKEFNEICYPEWIRYSLGIMVEEDDGLPPNICEECVNLVEQAYFFKKRCRTSDAKLREYMDILNNKYNGSSVLEFSEDHRDMFSRERTDEAQINLDDSGGPGPSTLFKKLFSELKSKQPEPAKIKTRAAIVAKEEDKHQKSSKTRMINQVMTYHLKGEKGEDGEEDLSRFEVVLLDSNEMSQDAGEGPSGLVFGAARNTASESQNMMRVMEIEQSWIMEEEIEAKDEEMEESSASDMIVEETSNPDTEIPMEISTHSRETDSSNSGDVPSIHYRCSDCSTVCKSAAGLKIHMRLCHKKNKKPIVRCAGCDRRFAFLSKLRRHKCKRSGHKPHTWGSFDHPLRQLHRYQYTHHTSKPYTCKICGKGYTQPINLTLHMRIHETRGKRYTCQHCDKKFRHGRDLLRHYESHKRVKHTCKDYRKTFDVVSALGKHLKGMDMTE